MPERIHKEGEGSEMAEWRNIGDILMNFGRITEADVKRAVTYQQENGGYFGEALLALDLVSQEELEWGLASQYDLPYVFPDADTIDPEAAGLVTPEWALAHLTLPIMKTAESLTVIVDSPIRTDAVDELQLRTNLRIDLALASGGKIRDLIRQVYAQAAAKEDAQESRAPVSLREAFGSAIDHGARRFGISTRGPAASVWYKEGGNVRRRPLDSRWQAELEEMITPSTREAVGDASRAEWTGHLNRDGMVAPIQISFLSSEAGTEYLFRPQKPAEGRFPAPPDGFLAEIRILARSGSARFLVSAEPEELGEEILPHLPVLLLERSWRSVHVTDTEDAVPEGVFTVVLPPARPEQAKVLLELHPFAFDAVSADISPPLEEWSTPLLNLAGCAFLLVREDADRQAAREAGIRWEMRVIRSDEGELEWDLQPLTE